MKASVYFVTGIDTGIGKSIATGLLLRALLQAGRPAISLKMVQTGNDGFSEDIQLHRRLTGTGELPEDRTRTTAPQIFRFPSSPKLAAELEHRQVDLSAISEAVQTLRKTHDPILVEGAGGLMVPLTADALTIDVVREQGWSVLLVTCGRLGSLNHTLLSLEALQTRKMPVAGILYVDQPDADPLIDRDSPAEIRRWCRRNLPAPAPLVHVPWIDLSAPAATLPVPDCAALFS